MIVFDKHILYPVNSKTDYIKLSPNKSVYYCISTDRQNKRWHIAITIENNGEVKIKHALTRMFNSYGECIEYLKQVPDLLDGEEFKPTLNNEMINELNRITDLMQHNLNMLNAFRRKYNI